MSPIIALPIIIAFIEVAFERISQPKIIGMYATWSAFLLPILSVNVPTISKPIGQTRYGMLAKI